MTIFSKFRVLFLTFRYYLIKFSNDYVCLNIIVKLSTKFHSESFFDTNSLSWFQIKISVMYIPLISYARIEEYPWCEVRPVFFLFYLIYIKHVIKLTS